MLSFLSSTLVLPHKIKSEFFILLVIFGFLAPIWTVCKFFQNSFQIIDIENFSKQSFFYSLEL